MTRRPAPPPAVPDMQRALRAFLRVRAEQPPAGPGPAAGTRRDPLDQVRALLTAAARPGRLAA